MKFHQLYCTLSVTTLPDLRTSKFHGELIEIYMQLYLFFLPNFENMLLNNLCLCFSPSIEEQPKYWSYLIIAKSTTFSEIHNSDLRSNSTKYSYVRINKLLHIYLFWCQTRLLIP